MIRLLHHPSRIYHVLQIRLVTCRSDQDSASGEKSDQGSSKVASDWVPMAHNGKGGSQEVTRDDTLSQFGDHYFADLNKHRSKKDGSSQLATPSEPPKIITSNKNVGDIISGKIPAEFAPFRQSTNEHSNVRTIDLKNGRDSDVVTGKISFERDRRKGSVVNDYVSSGAAESTKFGDTSNLVVSSVIKFS